MNLVDIGANLTGKSFKDDSESVVDEAVNVGVNKIMITGTTEDNSEQAIGQAIKNPAVLFTTAGVHPHHASEITDQTISRLAGLAEHNQVVAIGECGLDYNRNFSPRKEQLLAYELQLELAVESHLPVFLHQRDAHVDFLKILSRYRPELSGGVVHCFTGTRDELHAYLELDMHIGVTGWICDERRGVMLQEMVVDIPLSRLMLETDAPYLLPRSLKPKPKSNRNEPKYLPHICKTVADFMGKSPEEVALATSETAHKLFGLTTN